ncbi:MAG: choice-of-anchor D domain-containing protein [Solirubrobacterales bacterium]|nr:choice-of-anchor D domain-containing protein [Solirubrobacterales bacterium]
MGSRTVGLTLLAFISFFAVGAQAQAAPRVDVSPAQVRFGEQVLGEVYSPQYVEVDGIADPGVYVTSATLGGADPDAFSIDTYSCDDVELGEGVYCYIDVAFQPDEVGAKSATITIEADEGDPVVVPVSGTGVVPAANAPDLAEPTLNEPLEGATDLWGYAGGDFEGQGRAGVVTVSQMDDWSVSAGFAYGTPSGTLTTPFGREISGGGFAGSAATGAFDGDSDLDAVAAGGGTARAFLNEGDGEMDQGTELPVDENGLEGNLVTGEFTGDENLDVLAGYGTYDDETGENGYMLEVFPGEGDGTFGDAITQAVPVDGPMGMAAGDFDGDGVSDFTVSTWPGQVLMYAGDGDGTFTEVGRFGPSCGCQSPWGMATGDLNGDGRDDVIATMRFENQIEAYLSQADGSFVRQGKISLPLADGWDPNPYSVSAADLNGDGFLDLATGNYLNDTTTIFVGDGEGNFHFASNLAIDPEQSIGPHGTYIGDFNGDGRPDLSIAGQDAQVAIYLNQGEPGQPVADPTTVDFPDTVSGTDSAPVTVSLTNQGGLARLGVTGVQVGGGDSSDFAITDDGCQDASIPVGGRCEIEVAFTPQGPAGSRASALYLDTASDEQPQISVPLTGLATDPPPPAPGVSVDPATRDFGSVQIGQESQPGTIQVTSTGDEPLEISAVTVGGAAAADFPASSNCVGTFQPGAHCTLSFGFRPTVAGARAATVTLQTNAPGDPAAVELRGTGVAAPVTRAPRVIVRSRPKARIRIRGRVLRRVRVGFRSDQKGARFRCRIDRRKFAGCRSPKVFRRIRPGRHAIRIRAIKNGRVGPVKVIKFRVVRRVR